MSDSSKKSAKDGIARDNGRPVVLVVDGDMGSSGIVRDATSDLSATVTCVHGLGAGLEWTRKGAGGIDVAVIGETLPDGDGLQLVAALRRGCPGIRLVVLTDRRTYRGAAEAMHAGANEYLSRKAGPVVWRRILRRLLEINSSHPRRDRERVGKSDRQAAPSNGEDMIVARFRAAVAGELDLGAILRRYLEAVLQLAGTTNAAVFLPSIEGGFVVGGYINLDIPRDELDLTMDDLAAAMDTVLMRPNSPTLLQSPEQVHESIGVNCPWIKDREVLAVFCRSKSATAAGLLLFRQAGSPFNAATTQAVARLSPVLVHALERSLRVHRRLRDDGSVWGSGGSSSEHEQDDWSSN